MDPTYTWLALRKPSLQHPMQDLPGGGARHVVVADEGNRPRALVAGDAVPAPCHKLGLGDGGARVGDDHRVDPLTPFCIRYADHRHLFDVRMRADEVLDLRRIDVLAARDDHVALAVDPIVEAIRVAAGGAARRRASAARPLPLPCPQPP